jgi:hypothetical protein
MPPRSSTAILGASIVSVLALPSWMALHVQGVAQDEGDVVLLAEVGEPVPSEHALAGDGQPVAERIDGLKEGVGVGGEGQLEGGVAGGIEDAQGQGPGVQIDAAIESVALVVEPHRGLPVKGWLKLVSSSMPDAKRP